MPMPGGSHAIIFPFSILPGIAEVAEVYTAAVKETSIGSQEVLPLNQYSGKSQCFLRESSFRSDHSHGQSSGRAPILILRSMHVSSYMYQSYKHICCKVALQVPPTLAASQFSIMGEVDTAFIQAIEHRPKLAVTEAEGIPLIDLSPLNSSDSNAIARLVAEIGDACKNWGFFQVINHGVPLDCREKIESASRTFFTQSLEEKSKVRRSELSPMGYYDGEHTKNVRDWKEVFDFVVEVPTLISASHEPDDKELKMLHNQWPVYPPNFREACEDYTRETQKLSYKLLELISLSLGLPGKRFNEFFKDQTSFLRLNYYPRCPVPHLALGVGRHKDAGALTVLAQDDVGGLEVKRKTDGEWIRVKPTPDAYIVNVGDLIQVSINGNIKGNLISA